MHWADVAALSIYLLALVAIGFWVSRRVKSMEQFVMPRRFGKVLMITFSFGTGTHADEAVGVTSKTFTNGASGIWYQWLYLFCTPFYWLIAPVMKRFRAITTADIFEARYDKSIASLYTLIGMFTLLVDMGVMLKAFGSIVHASTGFPERTAIGLVTLVFMVYSVAGGLEAGIITDFIQGVLTVVFSVLLLPFVFRAIGGLEGLHAQIQDPRLLSMVAPQDIGVFYIAMLSLSGLIGIVTQPHILANCSSGKTEMDGRVGFMGGNMVKRFCTIAWCLIGLAAIVYFKGRPAAGGIKPDHVWGAVAKDFLSQAMPGLLGIFLASLLASLQSTANAVMICSSGLFTENIYKHFFPDREKRHYLLVARIASIVTVAGAVIFAWTVGEVVHGLEIFWKVGILMGIAFWLGLFWRRTTVAGAWASFSAAVLAWFLTTQGFFVAAVRALPMAESWRFVVERNGAGQIYLPWAILFYISAGLLAGIIVSLFTKPVDPARLENYYSLTRAPIQPGEELLAPCTLPPGARVEAPDYVFPGTSLMFQKPSRTSIGGFLFGWAFVAGIILMFYLIIRT
jgi:Na+/proline symporter